MSMAIVTSPVSARAKSGARSSATEKVTPESDASEAATTQPPRQPSIPTSSNGGLRTAVVRELERDAEVLFLDQRDDLLQIVAVLAGHAHLVLLDGGLDLDLAVLDHP